MLSRSDSNRCIACAALLGAAGARQRQRGAVGGGHVVRLRRQRLLEQPQRLVVAALLQVDLAEMDLRPGVGRIELQHPRERGDRLVEAVLGLRRQAEHEVRGGASGRRAAAARASTRGVGRVAAVEQRDRQIEPGEREIRRELQRLAERRRRAFVVELFQPRHAEVVGAPGRLAGRAGLRTGRRAGPAGGQPAAERSPGRRRAQ